MWLLAMSRAEPAQIVLLSEARQKFRYHLGRLAFQNILSNIPTIVRPRGSGFRTNKYGFLKILVGNSALMRARHAGLILN